MKNRIYIIHGWEGSPTANWFPWLKEELEKKGYEISVPQMPGAEAPEMEKWIPHLQSVAKSPDENTYFVGHSMGCQAIMRYLEELPEKTKVGGAVFVAGFFNLVNLSSSEEKEIVQPWLTTPIDFRKILSITDKFTAIFSTNDPWVPLSDKELFRKNLKVKVIVQKNKGHFTEDDNITKLPIVLEEILKLVK